MRISKEIFKLIITILNEWIKEIYFSCSDLREKDSFSVRHL